MQQCARIIQVEAPQSIFQCIKFDNGVAHVVNSLQAEELYGEVALTVEPQPIIFQKGSDSKLYFSATVPTPSEVVNYTECQVVPETSLPICVLWDSSTSHSSSMYDISVETDTLRSVLEMRKPQEIFLYFFDVSVRGPVILSDSDSVISAITGECCSGGTDFSCLKSGIPWDIMHFSVALLFSDGISSATTTDVQALSVLNCPLHTFCAFSGGNFELLSQLARNSGFFHNLSETRHNDCTSADVWEMYSWINNVTTDINGDFSVLPENLARVSKTTSFCGQVDSQVDGSSFKLLCTYKSSNSFSFSSSTNVTVNESASMYPPIISRKWAQKKIESLLHTHKHSDVHNEVLALCRQFGIICRGMSFIILDSLERYLKYRITPPTSLKELRTQFLLLEAKAQSIKEQEDEKYAGAILDWWRSRVNWWNNPPTGTSGTVLHFLASQMQDRFVKFVHSEPEPVLQRQSISNWKNTKVVLHNTHSDLSKGYTILLEKRLSRYSGGSFYSAENMDGAASSAPQGTRLERCGLGESRDYSAKYSHLTDTLRIAEQQMREEIKGKPEISDRRQRLRDLARNVTSCGYFMKNHLGAAPPAPCKRSRSRSISPKRRTGKRQRTSSYVSSLAPLHLQFMQQYYNAPDKDMPSKPPTPALRNLRAQAAILECIGDIDFAVFDPKARAMRAPASQVNCKPSISTEEEFCAREAYRAFDIAFHGKRSPKSKLQLLESQSFRAENSDAAIRFAYSAVCYYRANDTSTGFRIATNIPEIDPENTRFLRLVAYLFIRWHKFDEAIGYLNNLVTIRPEEPGPLLDMATALCYADSTNLEHLRRGYEILQTLVHKRWSKQYSQIELVAMMELSRTAFLLSSTTQCVYQVPVLLPLDIRVVIRFDTECDVELCVTEPSGETASSLKNCTSSGGVISREIKACGPIEYLLKKAAKGTYTFNARIFGPETPGNPVAVLCLLTVAFGMQSEKTEMSLIVLDTPKKLELLGAISFTGTGTPLFSIPG